MKSTESINTATSKDGTTATGEEPTEASEATMLEIAIASPETNNNEENSNPYGNVPPRKRFAKFFLGFLILAAVTAGCVSVLVVLLKKDPEENARDGASSTTPALVGCTRDVKTCPDGSVVGRDSANDCEFFSCPLIPTEEGTKEPATTPEPKPEEEQGQCPPDVNPREIKMCTDMTTVTRSGPNCEFGACPPGACMVDTMECPDGSFVGRDPANNCEFLPCPEAENTIDGEDPSSTTTSELEEGQCPPDVNPREIKMCTDLTTVTRSGPNCEFEACPAGACLVDTMACPDGSFVGRDPDNNCEFMPCAEETQGEATTEELQAEPEEEGGCPDGVDPNEIKFCPGGAIVGRSGPNCEMAPCP